MAMTDSEKNALKGLNPDGTPMNESQRQANKAKVDAKNAESIKKDKAEHGGRSLTERRTEGDPQQSMDDAQTRNKAAQNLTPEQKAESGMKGEDVFDPGDSDGDKKAVSPGDGNMLGGAPKDPEHEDPFKDTKAAWDHLTKVFGDKVSALQTELEGRLQNELTPTDRETGNPFAGDDVPGSKEMTMDDVKAATSATADDAKAVLKGVGEIGGAAVDVAGNGIREGANATMDSLGIDREAVKSTANSAKTLAGLTSLFSTGGESKVPDGDWKPKSINDLFKM